jgi:FkbM family methyltransferase
MIDRLASSFYGRSSQRGKRKIADLVARDLEAITYRRLAERGFRPGGIIDVGAYEGNWTRLANSVFGPVPTLMVEAQAKKAPLLQQVLKDLPNTRLASAALSDTNGQELTFYEMETGSSFLPEHSDAPRTSTTVVTQTLDDVAREMGEDLFLKIDVQGSELRVLSGGLETLHRSEVVQLEVALLNYNEGAPLMPEVVSYMADHGFFPTDLAGLSRPRDILVQMDILFAKPTSKLREEFFAFQ